MSDSRQQENVVEKIHRVPPDGGYGWVVAFAMGINSFFFMSMTHCFGLIYKGTFFELGFSATRIALIVNMYTSFGLLTGVFNGVLLKLCGYRKVAFIAAALYFCGLTFTSLTQNFILWYGMVASLGMGLCRSSYTLAVNTYFKERRSQAMSFATTIMGLGGIIMPQLINILLKFYSPDGVLLILAGLSGNFFVTSMLLQPVNWHTKEVTMKKPEPVVSPRPKNLLKAVIAIFDFDLLEDPVFLNILVGISLVFFAEINFNVLTPFILDDYGFSNTKIAAFMSTGGCTDIIFRILAPYIGAYLNRPPRYIFVLTLVLFMATTSVVLLFKDFYILLFCAVVLGMSRGIRRVYSTLIIPAHVSLEKLPAASGIGMMVNGVCTLSGGLLLGAIRDLKESYSPCIIAMNCVTLLATTLWCLEAVIVKYGRKGTKEVGKEENHPLNNEK